MPSPESRRCVFLDLSKKQKKQPKLVEFPPFSAERDHGQILSLMISSSRNAMTVILSTPPLFRTSHDVSPDQNGPWRTLQFQSYQHYYSCRSIVLRQRGRKNHKEEKIIIHNPTQAMAADNDRMTSRGGGVDLAGTLVDDVMGWPSHKIPPAFIIEHLHCRLF